MEEWWSIALYLSIPLGVVGYYWIRRKMSGGAGESDSSWRDITVIDVAIIVMIGAVFIR